MTETLLATATVADEPWTLAEIRQQPDTLHATQALLMRNRASVEAFVAPLLARPNLRIVLTGAGTSAFIGESLAPWLSDRLGRTVEAIATTDIVSAPALFLREDQPTLLVSFGRSGSSPESLAALDLADAALAEVHHLIITCNAQGSLALRSGATTHIIVLPEATHDRGFAMTSSFTAMLLAARSIFAGIVATDAQVPALIAGVARMLEQADSTVTALAAHEFDRVVYLGSGVFKGLAREAALKLMELSDGAVVTAYDTAMGFRHGPKTIITANTLAVVFVSADSLTRRYDLDILDELRNDGRCGTVLAITGEPVSGPMIAVPEMAECDDADLLFPFIVPAQLFGLRVSQQLGLTPDWPNVGGIVNRVVQGVRIHSNLI